MSDWQAGDLCTIPGSRDDYRAHIILTETGDFARGVRDVVKPFTEMVSCLFIGSDLKQENPYQIYVRYQYDTVGQTASANLR